MKKPVILLIALLISQFIQAQCVSGNCLNGIGVNIYPSGARYVGEFTRGARNGFGFCFFTDGSRYEGFWVNDVMEGEGIKILSNGRVEKGTWKKGQLAKSNPNLVLRHDGTTVRVKTGCLTGDCVNGPGFFVAADGTIYNGEFRNGKRNGFGVAYYAKDQYEGRWLNDLPDGMGTWTYADGTKRSGVWKKGTFSDPNLSPVPTTAVAGPTTDPGCLEGDCENGLGVYVYANGDRYSGTFKQGLPHGQGEILYASQDRFVGLLQEGQLHGKGVMYAANGRAVSGYWEHGRFVQSSVLEDPKMLSATETEAEVKIWSVIVGVANYKHMPVLRYTDDDAYRIYAFLKSPEGGAVADEQIRILVDEAATKQAIGSAVREVFGKAGPNDLVLLYFSGHGIPGAFLPIDYDGFNNKLFHDEINGLLRQTKAKYKLCIADACHSGSMGMASRNPQETASTIAGFYKQLAQAQPGTALIMSSKSEETSLEASGLRQGVFSHYLIRGLKGEADTNADKAVTIQELFDYVYQNVRNYTGNQQSPMIRGDYDHRMMVSTRQ